MILPFHLDYLEIAKRLMPLMVVVAVGLTHAVPLLREWRYGRAGFERRYQGTERLTLVVALGFGLVLPVMYVLSLPSLRERDATLTRFEALQPRQVLSVLIDSPGQKRRIEGYETLRKWFIWKASLEPVQKPLWGLGDPAGRAVLALEGLEETLELDFWPNGGPEPDKAAIEVVSNGRRMGVYRVTGFSTTAGSPVDE